MKFNWRTPIPKAGDEVCYTALRYIEEMKFSPQAQKAIDLIQTTNRNVFITGKAGTGKSTLLEHIRLFTKKKMVVLAPTGVAAINVNGDTLHSFFGLKPGFEKDEAEHMRMDEKKQKRFKSLKTIMIDEISMVRADMLDAIDIVLRRARKSSDPFGGVQMVFFGDLYQLPPVVTHADKDKFYAEYDAPYFFSAKVCKGKLDLFASEFDLEVIELSEIYRQTDRAFIDVLNAIRDDSATNKHYDLLNERFDPAFVPKGKKHIYLMTTNADAGRINDSELEKLNSDPVTFYAKTTGEIDKKMQPNDDEITVKVGAQIMFIYNDKERRWVNGTIGVIKEIKGLYNEEEKEFETIVIVETSDGRIVEVAPYKWEISKYVFVDGEFVREVIGSFRQIPLKLAWAITIHKSQGKTFDNVIIDLGRGSFAHGQTYVALSRCTSLEGVVLKKKIGPRSIIMDARVKTFNT